MKQAKAVYAFTARNENEISFEVGAELTVLEEDPSSGWSKGRTKEYREGYFPSNYVICEEVSDSDSDTEAENAKDITKATPPKIQCRALYDFNALLSTQLSFRKGLIINITKKGNENDWWEGELDGTHQQGLFPSNYVQLITQHDTNQPQPLPSSSSTSSVSSISSNNNNNNTDTAHSDNQRALLERVNSNQQYSLHEPTSSQPVIRVESKQSDTSDPSERKISEASEKKPIEQSERISHEPSASSPTKTPPNANQHRQSPGGFQSSYNRSPLNVLPPAYNENYATLSPVSPNLTLQAYNSFENARRRPMSMQFSSSPLSLAFSAEGTRDFDALCLLYPFLPSSISGGQNPPAQAPFTPSKLQASTSQPKTGSPPSTPQSHSSLQQPIQMSPPQHQHLLQNRPQSAPQSTPRSTSQPSVPATVVTPAPSLSTSPSTPSPSLQSTQQTSPATTKPVVPKLSLASNTDKKDRYANRERERERDRERERNDRSSERGERAERERGDRSDRQERLSSSIQGSNSRSFSRSQRYSSIKRVDSSTNGSASLGAVGAAGGSKRKVKLEGSLVMGKRPVSTMSHSNSVDNVLDNQDTSIDQSQPQQQQQHQQPDQKQNEVDFLKQILQQEVEVRMHLESIIHDAHGKLTSASQYIKDLKAELFQAHMDSSQLRVTNRQLSEQLDKYELVTRVTVATQTERDENIDKLRVLMEQIHELEANTEALNEQITLLKAKNSEKSPRSPSGDKGAKDLSLERSRSRTGEVRVDFAAVKHQFAKVRECIKLDKEEKERLIAEKVQSQEKLQKIEQQGKQIRRKLLTELQLKSDLNVRNQQIEFQMQKLREELAALKQHHTQ